MPALKLNRFDFIEYVRTHGNSEMSVGALLGIFDHITEIEEKTGQTYFVEPDEIFATYEEITLDEWNNQHISWRTTSALLKRIRRQLSLFGRNGPAL